MSADAQVIANYSADIPLSSAVNFFRSTPRWPSATDVFDLSFDYAVPVALTALIPIIFAFILTIAFIIHLVIRFTIRYTSTNSRLTRLSNSKRASYFLIPFSAALLVLICIFTSLGLVGNATLNHSSNDVMDVLNGLVNDISRSGFAVVDTAVLLSNRLKKFDPDNGPLPTALSETVGDLLIPTLVATHTYIVERYPVVGPLRSALSTFRQNIIDVLDIIRRALDIVYLVLLVIILLLLSAPPLLHIASKNRSSRFCAISFYVIYLFVPALLAWVLVGVVSAVGAIVSDVCVSLSDYRDHLRGISISNTTENAFISSGFVCPGGITGSELKTQIEDTAKSILQSDLAATTIERILNTSANEIAEAAKWSGKEVPRFVDCSAQVEFAGRLQLIACGRDSRSAVDGIVNMWVAFLGLSICLSIAMFASLTGINVLRALDIWPTLTDEDEVNMERGNKKSESSDIGEGDGEALATGMPVE